MLLCFGEKPWIPTGRELLVECSFYYTMRKTPKLAKLQAFENLHFMFSVETAGIFIKYILKSRLY